uniref:Histone RNA hairpin-binding protein RNA-binding domain-containing protein n=1 Tax=Arcella intermedia TaxID=1963864 RepID=A0A6B2LAU2_9EUKA
MTVEDMEDNKQHNKLNPLTHGTADRHNVDWSEFMCSKSWADMVEEEEEELRASLPAPPGPAPRAVAAAPLAVRADGGARSGRGFQKGYAKGGTYRTVQRSLFPSEPAPRPAPRPAAPLHASNGPSGRFSHPGPQGGCTYAPASGHAFQRKPSETSARGPDVAGHDENKENQRPVVEKKKRKYGTKFPKNGRETEPHRIEQRQKQINFGKNTEGYHNYLALIPKPQRLKSHPQTPNPYALCSKRNWDRQVRTWRRTLHLWDSDPSRATPDAEEDEEDHQEHSDEESDLEHDDQKQTTDQEIIVSFKDLKM